jgi:hypothetical protein
MRQFQNGVSADVLKDALEATLGIAVEVACVVAQGAEAAPARDGDGAPAAAPPPAAEGFAPGDEPAAEDPDAPPPPDAGPHGEDAALRLVESELGGKVLDPAGD